MATSSGAPGGWQRTFVVTGSMVLVVAGLYWAQKLVIPIVLSILLTFVLAPLVSFLQKRGLGRILSSISVLVFASLLMVGIAGVVLLQFKNLITELPAHGDQIVEKIKHLQEAGRESWFQQVQSSLEELVTRIRDEVAGPPLDNAQPTVVQVDRSNLMGTVVSGAGPVMETLVYIVLVIILIAFMLVQREALRNRVIRLWGHGSLTSMTRAIDDATRRISRFLLMQFVVNCTQGAIVATGLFLIGVPYAALWGFLTAMLRYIPYVGIWVAAVFPLMLSIAIFPDWTPPLLVFGLFLILELVNGNIVEPHVYGQSIGVSEVALLISAAFWTWLWGPFGLLLSTPLTACLAVMGRYVPGLEFFSILLGDEPVLEPHVAWYQRLVAHDENEAGELIECYLQTHSAEQMYDQVLVPGLALARQNRERGELPEEDEQRILRAAEETINELNDGEPQPAANGVNGVVVVGTPARDKADELALVMLSDSLPANACRLEIVSASLLHAEIIAEIHELHASVVVVAMLSAAGIAHTRYLCKRLRRRFPAVKILIGCWGFADLLERARKALQQTGVDHIGFSLAETRRQLLPLVQFLHNADNKATAGQPVLAATS